MSVPFAVFAVVTLVLLAALSHARARIRKLE